MDSKGAMEEQAEYKDKRDYAIMDHVISIQGYIYSLSTPYMSLVQTQDKFMDSKGAREEQAEEKEERDYAIMDHVWHHQYRGIYYYFTLYVYVI